MNRELLVSCIIPLTRTESISIDFVQKCHTFLQDKFDDFEIILAMESQYKLPFLTQLLEDLDSIRVLYLSGDMDIQLGYYSGLTTAIGDVIILTTTNNTIESLEEALLLSTEKNYDLITGISSERKRFLYRVFRSIYFYIFKSFISNDFPKNVSSLRVLSRNLSQFILKKNLNANQLFIFLSQINFPRTTVLHKCSPLYKSNLLSGVRQAITQVVYSSTRPLKFISFLGIIGSSLGFFISTYALIVHFLKENHIEGWTSLTLFVSIQFFLIFIILFFFGEYLARSVEQKEVGVSDRILFELNSTYLKKDDRYNVVSQ